MTDYEEPVVSMQAEIDRLRAEVERLTRTNRALAQQIAELKHDNESVATQRDSYKALADTLRAEVERLKAERKALIDALALYGNHTAACPCNYIVGIPRRDARCRCGFHAALKAWEDRR